MSSVFIGVSSIDDINSYQCIETIPRDFKDKQVPESGAGQFVRMSQTTHSRRSSEGQKLCPISKQNQLPKLAEVRQP